MSLHSRARSAYDAYWVIIVLVRNIVVYIFFLRQIQALLARIDSRVVVAGDPNTKGELISIRG